MLDITDYLYYNEINTDNLKRVLNMKIYEKIRIYIDNNGLEHINVAQKAGISAVTFDEMLDGKITLYADDLRAICLALNVSPEMFVDVQSV